MKLRVLVGLLVVAGAAAVPAHAGCGGGYAYAGVAGPDEVGGISASVTVVARPRVGAGHVAAWVGVGGYGLGPRGSDEWIQAGVVSRPGAGSRLYVEAVRPGLARTYLEVGPPVPRREAHRVAVHELAGAPGWWRAWLDGEPAGPPVRLPGSHGRFRPLAMAESWDGGREVCNRFRYRFARVSVDAGPDGSWELLSGGRVLADRGFRVLRETSATFVALAG